MSPVLCAFDVLHPARNLGEIPLSEQESLVRPQSQQTPQFYSEILALDPGVRTFFENESDASKACGSCGQENQKLGGSEKFKCGQCDRTLHRDVNGARNILIRFLTKFQGASVQA
mmetsp:Transcript_6080/g.23027  ORF Transcript_6080/g.23027 Transcript_6080/m.23027 type:complete len:115 (+) Transcript_6080:348-692(+)